MMSKEPKRNVYVGHRYVPKIMGEWNNEQSYEGLSIVTHQGTSYTSKKHVPVGVDILNEEYWVVTGNYNAQIEHYRQDVRDMQEQVNSKADIDYVNNEINNINNEINNVNNEIDNVTQQLTQKVGKDELVVNIVDYGAVPNNESIDNTNIIQDVYDNLSKGQTLYIPEGTFMASNLIFNRSDVFIRWHGIVKQITNATGVLLTIGHPTERVENVFVEGVIRLERNRDWTKENEGIRLSNLYHSKLTVDVRNFKTGVHLYASNKNGTTYNNITFNYIRNNQKSLTTTVVNGGWVTENKFFGGSFRWDSTVSSVNEGETLQEAYERNGTVHIDITNKEMNNNVFFSPSLEGWGGKFIHMNGRKNTMYAPRMEGESINIHYGSDSLYNKIDAPYLNDVTGEHIIDDGSRNIIIGRHDYYMPDTDLTVNTIVAHGRPNRNTSKEGIIDTRSASTSSDYLFIGRRANGDIRYYVNGLGHALFESVTSTGSIGNESFSVNSEGDISGILKLRRAGSLPPANEEHRGMLFIRTGTTGDELRVCLRKEDGTYEWRQVSP